MSLINKFITLIQGPSPIVIESVPLSPKEMTVLIQQINDMYSSTFNHYLTLIAIGVAIFAGIVTAILTVQNIVSKKDILQAKEAASKLKTDLKSLETTLEEYRRFDRKRQKYNLIELSSLLSVSDMSSRATNYQELFEVNSEIAKFVISAVCDNNLNDFPSLAKDNDDYNRDLCSRLLTSLKHVNNSINAEWVNIDNYRDKAVLSKQKHILLDTIKYIQDNMTSDCIMHHEITAQINIIMGSLAEKETKK